VCGIQMWVFNFVAISSNQCEFGICDSVFTNWMVWFYGTD
jgi:hypothetical protein